MACRKRVLEAKQKKASAKSKSKKPAQKGGIKKSISQVSKASPKTVSAKDATGTPEASDKDIQENSATGVKESAVGTAVSAKLRGKASAELKNNTSASGNTQASKSSL